MLIMTWHRSKWNPLTFSLQPPWWTRWDTFHLWFGSRANSEQARRIWEISCEDSNTLSSNKDGSHLASMYRDYFSSHTNVRLQPFSRSQHLYGLCVLCFFLTSFTRMSTRQFLLFEVKTKVTQDKMKDNVPQNSVCAADLIQHIDTLHTCRYLSCMRRCTVVSFYIPYISSSAHTCIDVCYMIQINVFSSLLLPRGFSFCLPWDSFTSWSWGTRSCWLTPHRHPHFSTLFMLFRLCFHRSRTQRRVSHLAGSRKVQNVHTSKFGCKYVWTVVDLSSWVCHQFCMVLYFGVRTLSDSEENLIF